MSGLPKADRLDIIQKHIDMVGLAPSLGETARIAIRRTKTARGDRPCSGPASQTVTLRRTLRRTRCFDSRQLARKVDGNLPRVRNQRPDGNARCG